MSIFLAIGAVVLSELFLFAPIALFLEYGWPVRKKAILAPFSNEVVKKYFQAFHPNDPRGSKGTRQDFEKEFVDRYGRRHYVVPSVILGLVSVYLVVLSVNSLFQHATGSTPFFSDVLSPITVAAFCGAYVWVVADLIARERTLDLSTTHVHWATFRLIVSLPLGFAFSQFATNDKVGLGVAILAGAFPGQTLGKMARRIAGKQLGIDDPPGDKRTRLDNLQNIDTTVSDRFVDEGITTIPQLAYADPVDITMRTGFKFIFVVDCVSQALLWVYMEDYYAAAKANGFRGALEVCGFLQEREDAENKGENQIFDDMRMLEQKRKVMEAFAVQAKVPVDVIEEQMDYIWNDTWVGFLVDLTDDGE
jgi:hypothetical protein